MRLLRASRWALLAFVLLMIPASSFAGVFISVGFAPPVMPVYAQPPCPEPGWIWTPGYWAYGPDGYYWVPGAWVPAPYEGALWTPPYWGWSDGLYMFHPGYWGPHVGYYGGVNYGFGYMGVGFVGGMWHGHDFVYNTAVVNVNRTVIHNTYIDRTIVERNTIVNERHVAYSGGPGGIRHEANRDERFAMNERHEAPTRIQEEHFQAARADRGSYVKNNGGRPQNSAVERPMGGDRNGASGDFKRNQGNARPNFDPRGNDNRPAVAPRNEHVMGGAPDVRGRPQFDARPAPAPQHQNEGRPGPDRPYQQPRQMESRPAPDRSYQQQRQMESRPAPDRSYQQPRQTESRPAPDRSYQQPRQTESRPAPQHESHQQPPHEQQGGPQRDHGNGKGR
jgi:hypothetical protein